jgi:hypothetical protein
VQRQTTPEEEEVQTKPLLQRQEKPEEEEVQTKPLPSAALRTSVQRRGDGSFEAGSELEAHLAVHQGGGSLLPEETRAYMELRFGADFSGVRVHTGDEATQLNRKLSAQAFTHGQDIYLGEGRYAPSSSAGKRLLAHELTHVVQQGGAPAGMRRQTNHGKPHLPAAIEKGEASPIQVHLREGLGLQRTPVPGLTNYGNFTDLGNGKFGTDQPTDAGEVAGLVNAIGSRVQNRRIKILTGTHGADTGDLVGEANFYKEDLVHEGYKRAGWINVFNVLTRRKANLTFLKEPLTSVVILAWCFSSISDRNWARVNAYKNEADWGSGKPIKNWA